MCVCNEMIYLQKCSISIYIKFEIFLCSSQYRKALKNLNSNEIINIDGNIVCAFMFTLE